MTITTELYRKQLPLWPEEGKHILAQYDDQSIIVYQAYSPAIAQYALINGEFGGDFSYSRMSWIKPNFLWMMFRSGWAQKENQEMVLGLRISRTFFDAILSQAVASSYGQSHLDTRQDWQDALGNSNVRLQWDPDHDPFGSKVTRRAIQLGLRGPVLEKFGKEELLEIIDMTQLIETQRKRVSPALLDQLETPKESVYQPEDTAVSQRLKLTSWASSQ